MGIPDMAISHVRGDLAAPAPLFDESVVRQFVSTESAPMGVARSNARRTAVLVRRAEVQPFPNIRCGPSFQNGVIPGTSQGWFTVAFEVPIWDRNQGNIHQARAENRGAMFNMNVVRNDLLRQTAEVASRYRAAYQLRQRINDVILPNADRTLRLSRDGYDKGIIDLPRYLQAQRLYSETLLNYVQASERLWLTGSELAGLFQVERFP